MLRFVLHTTNQYHHMTGQYKPGQHFGTWLDVRELEVLILELGAVDALAATPVAAGEVAALCQRAVSLRRKERGRW